MKEKFNGRLDVKIYTLDSEEAKPYALEFRGSTNVLLDNEWVPLGIATDTIQMETLLSEKI
ncbi:MAG: hypothetical protein R6X10_09955 [Desulfobacterales bacterium]